MKSASCDAHIPNENKTNMIISERFNAIEKKNIKISSQSFPSF